MDVKDEGHEGAVDPGVFAETSLSPVAHAFHSQGHFTCNAGQIRGYTLQGTAAAPRSVCLFKAMFASIHLLISHRYFLKCEVKNVIQEDASRSFWRWR